jgi:hypothetical protein
VTKWDENRKWDYPWKNGITSFQFVNQNGITCDKMGELNGHVIYEHEISWSDGLGNFIG